MMSIIVTGHGRFAEGMLSAVQLVAGDQAGLYAVNFVQEDNNDDLRSSLTSLLSQCDGEVLVLTDIAGGSPFNTSVLLRTAITDRHIEVLSGANLPILLTAVMERESRSLSELCRTLLTSGQRSIRQFHPRKPVAPLPDLDGM